MFAAEPMTTRFAASPAPLSAPSGPPPAKELMTSVPLFTTTPPVLAVAVPPPLKMLLPVRMRTPPPVLVSAALPVPAPLALPVITPDTVAKSVVVVPLSST